MSVRVQVPSSVLIKAFSFERALLFKDFFELFCLLVFFLNEVN